MRQQLMVVGVVVCFQAVSLVAQNQPGTIRVQVRAEDKPVEKAEVLVAGAVQQTDASGTAQFQVPAGEAELTVVKSGYVTTTVKVTVAAGAQQDVTVDLQPEPTLEETVTVVATTRTGKRLEDQPMRVEVLSREEIEEKMLMTPGDIVMMLNEMGGMRVQTTSPSIGAASVRIQGMRGRYTRVLSDGLPLFGEVGGLGLLQIPPMDLGKVEVVKGVASALYGAGAMGGIINLLSRRPTAEPQREFLLNRSTRGATDAVAFLAAPLSAGWSTSLLSGAHWQEIVDVNDDGWADLPGYARAVVRPRVFWDGGDGRSFFATAGFTYEDREGGTPNGSVLPATGAPYVEALETRRYDAGAFGQFLLQNRYVVTARAAVARQSHDHQFGEVLERDHHDTAFGEIAIRGTAGRQTWVGGIAIERDAYTPRDVPQFEYAFVVPGAFGQYDFTLTPGCVALGERPCGRSQRVRHVLQPADFAPRTHRAMDEPRFSRHGILRLDATNGRNGGSRPDAPAARAAARSRTRFERLVRYHADGRTLLLHRHVVRVSDRRSRSRRSLNRLCAPEPRRSHDECWRRTARHVQERTLLGHRDLRLRSCARDRRRSRPGCSANAPS